MPGEGNGKIRGLQPGVWQASPSTHACVHGAFAALTFFGATSLECERPCYPVVHNSVHGSVPSPRGWGTTGHRGCCLRWQRGAETPQWGRMPSSRPHLNSAVHVLQLGCSFPVLKLHCLGVDTGG